MQIKIFTMLLFVLFNYNINSTYSSQQEQDAWCWAAVSSMAIFNITGHYFKQCEIANVMFKDNLDCCENNKEKCNQTITDIDLENMLIHDFAFDISQNECPDKETMLQFIKNKYVIIAGIRKYSYNDIVNVKEYNHFVMLLDYKNEFLTIYDPEEKTYIVKHYDLLFNDCYFVFIINKF